MEKNLRFNRRKFLRESAKFGASGLAGLSALTPSGAAAETHNVSDTLSENSRFQTLSPPIEVYRGSINTGIIRSRNRALLIDSGDGSVLDAIRKRGIVSVEWVLFTHYHRDQCSGVSQLKAAGAKIAVPAAEAWLFRDATDFWATANKRLYHRYDYRPEFLVLRDSVEPDRELQPDTVFTWEGIRIHIVATPGHTDGSVSYVVDVDGRRMCIHGRPDLRAGSGV